MLWLCHAMSIFSREKKKNGTQLAEVPFRDLATHLAGEAPSELYESVVVGLLDKNKRRGQPQ